VIASLQAQMLFPIGAVGPPGPLPPSAVQVSVDTPDGQKLRGIHIPSSSRAHERVLVLGFGGNAWNGSDVAAYLHDVYPEADVVAFHYRGYRPSGGAPSARALLADAPLVHDFAVERVRAERVIAVGFSIGSGVAASLARQRRLDGLILVTPFDSLKAVAASLMPWLPIGPFFEHEMNTAEFLEGSDVPVAIVAAERDEIVHPPRTEALRRTVANLKFDRTIPSSGHNDIYARSDFQAALRDALAAVSQNDSNGDKP
jgi:pimeloyl-ACP methyl ester carboxylesterase